MPRQRKPRSELPGDCYTIEEFCQRNRISKQFYYKLRAKGQTPAEMRFGTRVLITKEAATEWRQRFSPPPDAPATDAAA